jgi:c-di-GMP-binding flagellar brake protein YcgR
VEEDQREYERLPATFPLSFTGNDIAGGGMAYEVSMSGCSFHPTNAPKQGDVLRMALRLSRDFPPVEVEAVVRHIGQDRVGVEFLRFELVQKARLQNYIRELLKHRAEGAEAGVQIANGQSM